MKKSDMCIAHIHCNKLSCRTDRRLFVNDNPYKETYRHTEFNETVFSIFQEIDFLEFHQNPKDITFILTQSKSKTVFSENFFLIYNEVVFY